MTVLLSCQAVSKSYGARILFKDLFLSIFAGDRMGLIGPNGSGKSTFLKILAGQETAENGQISSRRDLKIGYVPQTCEFEDLPCGDILRNALSSAVPEHEKEYRSKTWLSKLGFTGEEPSAALLSGGWKKRLGLAVELVKEPDLLLLDEPTNHLDLEGILWLEKLLTSANFAWVMVSHDRFLLERTASRIAEAINETLKGFFSEAKDVGAVDVTVPPSFADRLVDFVAEIEGIEVLADVKAIVVLNERTGTVVMGENVRISTVAVAQGNLIVKVEETPQVSQPNPFAPEGAETVVVPREQGYGLPASESLLIELNGELQGRGSVIGLGGTVQVDGRLVRIERHQGEYWILTLMLCGLKTQWSRCVDRTLPSWKYAEGLFAEQLHQVLQCLPQHLWPEKRRKRTYVNQVLARAERGGDDALAALLSA